MIIWNLVLKENDIFNALQRCYKFDIFKLPLAPLYWESMLCIRMLHDPWIKDKDKEALFNAAFLKQST